MIIGNILCSEKIKDNYFNNIDELGNNNLPTLIIGWSKVNELFPNKKISILNKKINSSLYWTFNSNERKVDLEIDLENFKTLCLDIIDKKNKYIYVDIIHYKKRKIKKILRKIKELNNIITYINNKGMVYIFSDNLVFGVDLNICEYIGIKKHKIIDKVKSISDVTLQQNEIFNICKDLIKNNREKIIPYIYYNGTNNKNSNSSIIC